MGVGPGEANELSLWEFSAMRTHWNRRQPKADGEDTNDDGEPIELPSEEFVRQRQAELNETGIATGSA